jgi:hypothetical protein
LEAGVIDVKFKEGRLQLKGCFPHYRRPLAEIIALRHAIYDQLVAQRVALPIKKKLHLSINATRHEHGCDLSNIVQAICQALDGKTLSIEKHDIILVDDSQIISLSARWINS